MREPAQLASEMEHWYRTNRLGNTKLAGGSANSVDRYKNRVLIRVANQTQILGFRKYSSGESGNECVAFFAFCPNVDGDHIGKITRAMDTQLEELASLRVNEEGTKKTTQRNVYDSIFEKHSIQMETLEYRGHVFDGVLVEAPIKELPFGKRGRLSDNLFEYSWRGVVRPTFRFAVPVYLSS
ncbi:hypothetical protein AUJ84_01800 [Candidatus Pacearchaeota archaeon CG1_02_32_132]|nr:MAG: hypothetical protein AUJ84_01800 [Candidatus Pacearchaeota archaeon CG1_02_32_132]